MMLIRADRKGFWLNHLHLISQAIRDHAEDASSEDVMNCIPETDCYVLNDGSFLPCLNGGKKGDTYNVIEESFANFT
ncbi:hypothetical protein DPMN_132344 [Dreissena polymorpha]|uniref:Uncharacterized protein n=1 Tax=Dreissena polymorpha TaxID=45954 RepID=A0A9D4J8S8_DREPO|nr:hypothetical protein DPMN_132344 [Dreissena polymorpha]